MKEKMCVTTGAMTLILTVQESVLSKGFSFSRLTPAGTPVLPSARRGPVLCFSGRSDNGGLTLPFVFYTLFISLGVL